MSVSETASFDIAVSRHLLWTLPHPNAAIDQWVRVLRPGGRLIVVESQAIVTASPERLDNARSSPEYAAIGDRLPFVSGWPREEIEKQFAAHRLVNLGSDPFFDRRCGRAADEGGRARTAHSATLCRLGRRAALTRRLLWNLAVGFRSGNKCEYTEFPMEVLLCEIP